MSVSSALHPSSLPDIYGHSLAPTLVSATYHIVPKAVIATQKQDKVIHADSAFLILIILLVRLVSLIRMARMVRVLGCFLGNVVWSVLVYSGLVWSGLER